MTPERLGTPRESWLRSEDSRRFAEAMVRCQGAGTFCWADGFCHYEGACFRRPSRTIEERVAMLEERVKALESVARGGVADG